MNDYTPTTEEVLKSWLHAGEPSAEFHRWLAEVKAEAWEEGLIDGKMVEWRGTRKNPYLQGEEQ